MNFELFMDNCNCSIKDVIVSKLSSGSRIRPCKLRYYIKSAIRHQFLDELLFILKHFHLNPYICSFDTVKLNYNTNQFSMIKKILLEFNINLPPSCTGTEPMLIFNPRVYISRFALHSLSLSKDILNDESDNVVDTGFKITDITYIQNYNIMRNFGWIGLAHNDYLSPDEFVSVVLKGPIIINGLIDTSMISKDLNHELIAQSRLVGSYLFKDKPSHLWDNLLINLMRKKFSTYGSKPNFLSHRQFKLFKSIMSNITTKIRCKKSNVSDKLWQEIKLKHPYINVEIDEKQSVQITEAGPINHITLNTYEQKQLEQELDNLITEDIIIEEVEEIKKIIIEEDVTSYTKSKGMHMPKPLVEDIADRYGHITVTSLRNCFEWNDKTQVLRTSTWFTENNKETWKNDPQVHSYLDIVNRGLKERTHIEKKKKIVSQPVKVKKEKIIKSIDKIEVDKFIHKLKLRKEKIKFNLRSIMAQPNAFELKIKNTYDALTVENLPAYIKRYEHKVERKSTKRIYKTESCRKFAMDQLTHQRVGYSNKYLIQVKPNNRQGKYTEKDAADFINNEKSKGLEVYVRYRNADEPKIDLSLKKEKTPINPILDKFKDEMISTISTHNETEIRIPVITVANMYHNKRKFIPKSLHYQSSFLKPSYCVLKYYGNQNSGKSGLIKKNAEGIPVEFRPIYLLDKLINRARNLFKDKNLIIT
jgi:hypothetical protein